MKYFLMLVLAMISINMSACSRAVEQGGEAIGNISNNATKESEKYNRSCKVDKDCKQACPIGCINANQEYQAPLGVDCTNIKCGCINNECVPYYGDTFKDNCFNIEEEILKTVDKVKTCNSDSDCFLDTSIYVGLPSVCHFVRSHQYDDGEYISLLKEMVKQYQSECSIYSLKCNSAPKQSDVICNNNKCTDKRRL